MVLDFQLEAAKRRHNPGSGLATNTNRLNKVASTFERMAPHVEFGSGWYHSAAVKEVPAIEDHRDWH